MMKKVCLLALTGVLTPVLVPPCSVWTQAPQAADPAKAEEGPWLVGMRQGDRIRATEWELSKDELTVTTAFGRISMSGASVAWVAAGGRMVLDALPDADIVWVWHGDDFEPWEMPRDLGKVEQFKRGTVEEVKQGKLRLRTKDGKKVSLELRKVKEVVLQVSPGRAKETRASPPGPATVRLTDASILSGRLLGIAKGQARLSLPYVAGEVTVPVSVIDSISFPKAKEDMKAEPAISMVSTRAAGYVRGRVTVAWPRTAQPLTGCRLYFYNSKSKRFYAEDTPLLAHDRHTADGYYVSPPLEPGVHTILAVFKFPNVGQFLTGSVKSVEIRGGETVVEDFELGTSEETAYTFGAPVAYCTERFPNFPEVTPTDLEKRDPDFAEAVQALARFFETAPIPWYSYLNE